MIKPEELYGIKHYDYGEEYFGSDKGMRFRVARQPLMSKDDEEGRAPVLKATVWYTPFSYENTPESDKKDKEFEYSKEGYEEMIGWLNSCGGGDR